MAENKLVATSRDVHQFIGNVENSGRQEDAWLLLNLFSEVSGEKPVIWNPSIIGFGQYHYKYESGHEGDCFLTGFSPRKANMVVYIMPGFSKYGALLEKLGKHKTGASCLYLGRLKNIDIKILRRLVDRSVKDMRKKYS